VAEPNVRFLAERLRRCLAEPEAVAQEVDMFYQIEAEHEEPEYSVSLPI
jgi:hypothetical protein